MGVAQGGALRILAAISLAAILALGTGITASAHPHVIGKNGQVLANGQNHPGFQPADEDGLRLSCEGVLEPGDSGPAGYGLETAHHGPDAGQPGKSDGCYATEGDPQDNNPAID